MSTSPMTTTETLHLVVDIAHDLMMSSDETLTLLRDIADGSAPAQEVGGILVTEDNADLLRQDYVAAWEDAWIRTAEAMGHDAIAAGGGSSEAHDHIRRNSAEALDRSDTGMSAVDEAWEAVWDACPTVTLTEAISEPAGAGRIDMTTTPTMKDDKGTVICIGDIVQVLYINRDRGTEMWMYRGEVVGFGRTRVKVQFPARTEPQTVGPECLRVVGSRRSFG